MLKYFKNKKEIKNVNALILGVGYEGYLTNMKGTRKGPSRIIDTFDNHLESFDRFTENEPDNIFDFGYYEMVGANNFFRKSSSVMNEISSILDKFNGFSILLGGSHSVSNGFFNYLSKKEKPSDITILQIDAHPDLRYSTDDYAVGKDKYNHACVMRRAHELGFNIVQVGIRNISKFDFDFIRQKNIKVFEWGRGKEYSTEEIINSIPTEKVYLTFDIDGLDPSCAPATGTPIPGGLDFYYAQRLIRDLIKNKNLIGADIVEVSPIKNSVLTEYTAALLCYNIISYKLLKDNNKLIFK